jgi:hypothetical protein
MTVLTQNNAALESGIRVSSPPHRFNLEFKNIKLHKVNKDTVFKAQTSCGGGKLNRKASKQRSVTKPASEGKRR